MKTAHSYCPMADAIAPCADQTRRHETTDEQPRGFRNPAPSLFWYVGGTDPDLYQHAEQAGPIAQDVPTNHSSRFAPVLHPTLETGIQALTVASLSHLRVG